MVCNKNSDSKHDFDLNGIPVKLQQKTEQQKSDSDSNTVTNTTNWLLSAVSSTLGADNGVGIAAGLALMEVLPSDQHPDLELLATVNEETDFSGAEKIGLPDVGGFL